MPILSTNPSGKYSSPTQKFSWMLIEFHSCPYSEWSQATPASRSCILMIPSRKWLSTRALASQKATYLTETKFERVGLDIPHARKPFYAKKTIVLSIHLDANWIFFYLDAGDAQMKSFKMKACMYLWLPSCNPNLRYFYSFILSKIKKKIFWSGRFSGVYKVSNFLTAKLLIKVTYLRVGDCTSIGTLLRRPWRVLEGTLVLMTWKPWKG